MKRQVREFSGRCRLSRSRSQRSRRRRPRRRLEARGVGRVVGTLQQTGEVVGGTGRFAAASAGYTATVTRPGLLARNPDGGCSFEQPALHEVDMFAITGTLLF